MGSIHDFQSDLRMASLVASVKTESQLYIKVLLSDITWPKQQATWWILPTVKHLPPYNILNNMELENKWGMTGQSMAPLAGSGLSVPLS